MLAMIRKINNQIMPLFGVRIERASSYRFREQEQQRKEALSRSSVARQRIIELAKFLKLRKALGVSKVRIGDSSDGGYVCLDDLTGLAAAFSFGISDNASWDCGIADRGLIVHQFDHTVDEPPKSHPNFRFEKNRSCQ
jgi:hypothetical protein